MNSEITGWFQSDVIIRSALVEGIADLRRNPYLIDFIFASLAKDDLTKAVYGEKEIAQAKKWFRATEIPVFMATRLDKPKFPCVSISLLESSETENTLADVHSTPSEDNDSEWPDLSDPFSPTSYTASTGIMVLPTVVTDNLILAPGMVIMDDVGRAHTILEVSDRDTIVLAENTVAAFGNATVRGQRPSRVTTIESCKMKEAYQIGCHVMGESFFLTYLHSIISFILLRYKEVLMEARGYERSTISSSDFRRNDYWESENVFSRHINLTGYVQQMWPKLISNKITGSSVVPVYSSTGTSIDVVVPEINVDSEDSWLADSDGLGVKG